MRRASGFCRHKGTSRNSLCSCLQARLRGHRVETAWLALSVGPFGALAKGQKPKSASSEAGGRGGLGSAPLDKETKADSGHARGVLTKKRPTHPHWLKVKNPKPPEHKLFWSDRVVIGGRRRMWLPLIQFDDVLGPGPRWGLLFSLRSLTFVRALPAHAPLRPAVRKNSRSL
jgi:hypothetical protein